MHAGVSEARGVLAAFVITIVSLLVFIDHRFTASRAAATPPQPISISPKPCVAMMDRMAAERGEFCGDTLPGTFCGEFSCGNGLAKVEGYCDGAGSWDPRPHCDDVKVKLANTATKEGQSMLEVHRSRSCISLVNCSA